MICNSNADTKGDVELASITADGTKAYRDILLELDAYLPGSAKCILVIDSNYYQRIGSSQFSRLSYGSGAFHFERILISSTTATFHKGDMSDAGAYTHTNISTDVPSQGTLFKLIM